MFENVNKKPLIVTISVVTVLAVLTTFVYFFTSRNTVELGLTYSNEEAGIEFQYPYAWALNEYGSGTQKQFVIEKGLDPNKHQIIISVDGSNVEIAYKPGKDENEQDRAVYEAVKNSIKKP